MFHIFAADEKHFIILNKTTVEVGGEYWLDKWEW